VERRGFSIVAPDGEFVLTFSEMRHGSTRRLVVGIVCLASMSCAKPPNGLWVPHVPNPVVLGPVDRIGGHRAQQIGDVRADVSAETAITVLVFSSDTSTSETVTRDDRAGSASVAVLRATHGDPSDDVRVLELKTDAWLFSPLALLGFSSTHRSVALTGEVVDAGHKP
jgi:hypothetical protein